MSRSEARPRNPRGEGSRLRADIVDAAGSILDETGDPAAITLRAVARAVGISAPSIYAHFADREAILDQLLADSFKLFSASLTAGIAHLSDAVERLYALGYAYLEFASKHPQRYQLLFQHPEVRRSETEVGVEAQEAGEAALDILVQAIAACAQAGRSDSTDHSTDAVAVWAAMHGLVMLQAKCPEDFRWPDQAALLTAIADRLVQLHP